MFVMNYCLDLFKLYINYILVPLILYLIYNPILKLYFSRRDGLYRKENGLRSDTKIIGFFHPFCNSGGGGERVLWIALRALIVKYPDYHYVVYTGDVEVTPEEILKKVNNNFKISLKSEIKFIYLNKRRFVSPELYPYFTLLGQSLGSIVLSLEAINKCVPNVFIDSMGYSFSYPIFKYLGNCRVGAYVHFPTISTDMLDVVSNTVTTYNNRAFITNSRALTLCKLIYYKIFAYIYGVVGRMADVVMVNSSWTHQHIKQLWKCELNIVYPPCNTNDFKKLDLQAKKELQIVSIGQIRPEKNHVLQLNAFKKFIDELPVEMLNDKYVKLIIIGSCRDAEDVKRAQQLERLCHKLNIENRVEFKLNISYEELKLVIQESSIGLHTMINEHFGIGVVELLAAGLITIAHDSGGPKLDIITHNETGFLASDLESFSVTLVNISKTDTNRLNDIRVKARESVNRFSEENFEKSFLKSISKIL